MDLAVTIFDHAVLLVSEILKARRELHDAPQKLLDLVGQVEVAQVVLNKIRETNSYGEDSFKKYLNDLGEELMCAQEKVEKYRKRAERRKGEVLEIAKATFGQGAAKQNQSTESIRERIRKLLEQLNQLVNVETSRQVSNLTETVQHNQLVNIDTNQKVSGLSETVKLHHLVNFDTNLKVTSLVEMTLAQYVRPQSSSASIPRLISKLDELSIASLDEEDCTVNVEIANSHTSDFHTPLVEMQSSSSSGDEGTRRAAKKGGYEIANFTKVKFSIEVEEDRYFYVIVYDATEATEPSLFFPESTSMKNKLTSKFKRSFPDPIKFGSDPLSLVMEKSERLGANGIGRQNVYILLSCNNLHSDNTKHLQLRDIEGNIDDGVFVKQFIFDIK